MSRLNNSRLRNKLAQSAISGGKIACCFGDIAIEDLRFLDLDTLDRIKVDDVEPGMDVQVSDGYDTYEMYGIIDAVIYDDEYLVIETEDHILTNASIDVEINRQKLDSAFQNSGEHENPHRPGDRFDFDKNTEPDKDEEWYMGVDSTGYYFGEKYEDD